MTDELRCYCLIRTDIEIPRPKAMVQAGHAFTFLLFQALKNTPDLVHRYVESDLQMKVILDGKNLAMLERIAEAVKDAGLPFFLLIDAGRTVFPEPTVTCLSVGPMSKEQMPPLMKRLQLLKS